MAATAFCLNVAYAAGRLYSCLLYTSYLYLDEDYPYLACYVDYEITYMSDEILCVAFQDHYFNAVSYTHLVIRNTKWQPPRNGDPEYKVAAAADLNKIE